MRPTSFVKQVVSDILVHEATPAAIQMLADHIREVSKNQKEGEHYAQKLLKGKITIGLIRDLVAKYASTTERRQFLKQLRQKCRSNNRRWRKNNWRAWSGFPVDILKNKSKSKFWDIADKHRENIVKMLEKSGNLDKDSK